MRHRNAIRSPFCNCVSRRATIPEFKRIVSKVLDCDFVVNSLLDGEIFSAISSLFLECSLLVSDDELR